LNILRGDNDYLRPTKKDFDLLVKKQSVKRSKIVKGGLIGGGGVFLKLINTGLPRVLDAFFLKKIKKVT